MLTEVATDTAQVSWEGGKKKFFFSSGGLGPKADVGVNVTRERKILLGEQAGVNET